MGVRPRRPAEDPERPSGWRPDRRAGVTLLLYLLVVGVGATGIYDPLEQGRNHSWVVAIGLVGALLALGVGVGRLWALAPAVLAAAMAALIWWDPYLLFGLALLTPVALGVTGLGLLLARSPHPTRVMVVAFLAAAPGLAWGLAEAIDRADAPRVSPALERQLTSEGYLANLCPGAETPKRFRPRLEAQAETLIREVQRHPDWLLPYTYYSSDKPDERREITIRELAEEELSAYEAAGPRCEGGYQERLREALD